MGIDPEGVSMPDTIDRREAVSTGLAILFGYFSIAVAFGVSGEAVSLPAFAVAGLSVFVFAGASQFMAVSLIAQGAGAIPIIAATLVLNSRHIVMSMSLRDRVLGTRIPRPVLAFGITDEVFTAAATRPGPIGERELLTMELLAYSGWVSGTIAGFVVGGLLPATIEQAMGIALYAMFVALIVPAIVRFPRYLWPALAAGGTNWLFQRLGAPVGVSLLLAITLVALGFALLPAWSEEESA
ncbi:MAG: AzlC family ABC transporter permease [Spirochaetota bacterium]